MGQSYKPGSVVVKTEVKPELTGVNGVGLLGLLIFWNHRTKKPLADLTTVYRPLSLAVYFQPTNGSPVMLVGGHKVKSATIRAHGCEIACLFRK